MGYSSPRFRPAGGGLAGEYGLVRRSCHDALAKDRLHTQQCFVLPLASIGCGRARAAIPGDSHLHGPWRRRRSLHRIDSLPRKFLGTSYSNVFSLQSENGSWVLTPIFNFPLGPYTDGIWPFGKVVVGPDGALYGTTYEGGLPGGCGDDDGCGVVYRLTPPSSFCRSVQCFWTETVLHTFTGGADGGNPVSEVVFDRAGKSVWHCACWRQLKLPLWLRCCVRNESIAWWLDADRHLQLHGWG